MIVMALALALQPAPTAAGNEARWASIGYGICEDWTRARAVSHDRAVRMAQWAWGYLTAFRRYGHPNRQVATSFLRTPILGELDVYCAAHQEALFGDAVSLLVEQHYRRRSRRR